MFESYCAMTNVLDDLQPAQSRKKLEKCVMLSSRIVGGQSMTFAILCNIRTRYASAFLSGELNMMRIAAKFMPRLLTDEQKYHRLEVRMKLQDHVRNDQDFLFKVVTSDEIWAYGTTRK